MSTANIADGGYFAWVEPAICDEDENAYFLIAPHWRDGQEPAAGSGAPSPRDVVRVSSDGKKRVTFSPGKGSKFSSATELKTLAIAVDRDGALSMLVWAAWHDKAGKPEKSGQYIVSFDRKGEYRSHLEVDWHEMLVNQFEVFGSGEFLLRGRRIQPAESRLAILSSSRQTLQDVAIWSGRPLDEPPPESAPQSRFDRMVRGGDGRIYVTQEDDVGQGDVVLAISASGESERIFKLPRLSKDPPLVAWKSANDRFAASYRSEGSAEQAGHWWIAVYNSGQGEEPEATLYGPAPGPLLCYRRGGAGNRFTFLMDGTKLVTMSAAPY